MGCFIVIWRCLLVKSQNLIYHKNSSQRHYPSKCPLLFLWKIWNMCQWLSNHSLSQNFFTILQQWFLGTKLLTVFRDLYGRQQGGAKWTLTPLTPLTITSTCPHPSFTSDFPLPQLQFNNGLHPPRKNPPYEHAYVHLTTFTVGCLMVKYGVVKNCWYIWKISFCHCYNTRNFTQGFPPVQ